MEEDTLLIFTDNTEESSGRPKTRGLREEMHKVTARVSAVTVSTVQANMTRFLNSLDAVLRTSPKEVGGLTIEEVEIHVQIDGKGNVGISGVVGAETTTQGGLKIVLRKKWPSENGSASST